MKLKTLIVDDEYPARKELRTLLQKYDQIQVVGEATNSYEALELISALEYSVLFLDIDMPGCNGLELCEKIKELPRPYPYVIFVTAHESYALKAFGVDAIDYLLKPINTKRLDEAMAKVVRLETNTAKSVYQKPAAPPPGDTRLDLVPVDHRGKTILINEKDIIFAYTDNDYVYIKTFQDKYLTRFTMRELESRLDPKQFFRSHRCYLVNIRKTKEVIPFFNGTYTLVVDDAQKSEIPVSRAQSKKLREILGM